MGTSMVIWHGSSELYGELVQSVDRNCTCPKPPVAGLRCPAHGLLDSQFSIDHLLWFRMAQALLMGEEFQTQGMPSWHEPL